MNWIITIVIGALVGWLASILMKTNAQMGAIANILVGVIGSVIGGWAVTQLGLPVQGFFLRTLVSIGGACLLIALLKILRILK